MSVSDSELISWPTHGSQFTVWKLLLQTGLGTRRLCSHRQYSPNIGSDQTPALFFAQVNVALPDWIQGARGRQTQSSPFKPKRVPSSGMNSELGSGLASLFATALLCDAELGPLSHPLGVGARRASLRALQALASSLTIIIICPFLLGLREWLGRTLGCGLTSHLLPQRAAGSCSQVPVRWVGLRRFSSHWRYE